MKTKEFIEKVEELGFRAEESDSGIDVINGVFQHLCHVSKTFRFVLDTDWTEFEEAGEATREDLYKLAVEYANTPLEEREEEKKYVYKFPFNVIYETKKDLYVFKILYGGLNLSNAAVHDPEINSRYHFTDKEVEKFTGKDRELFNVCEKIEVTP